jgi:porphobilinogen synthase
MIKPALSYLDVIAEAKKRFNIPISAYSVSGEYAMVKAAANQGWIKEDQIINEILYSIKRAGADFIVTYFAKSGAKLISDNS